MRTTKVKQGQTFFDTVIEATGDITNAFDMAMANSLSVTDVLFNQMDVVVAGTEKKVITQLFLINKPASTDKESYAIYDYIFSQTLPFIL